MIVILVLSVVPGSAFEPVEIPFWKQIYLDKIVHAGMYFLLYCFIRPGLFSLSPRYAVITALLITISYGGLMELVQGIKIIARSSDFKDMIGNITGAVFATVFFPLLIKKRFFYNIFISMR